MQQQDNLSKKDLVIIYLVIAISIFSIFVSDIFIPALPLIQTDLDTTKKLLEFSIPMYFFIFAIAQLIFGPLSEVHGRKNIILIGLSIGLVGSLFVLVSFNIYMLLFGRAIQAIGLSAPVTLSRVIIRDKVKGDRLYAKISSYMSAAILLAPVLAPIIGSFLTIYFNWRSNFIFLILVNILCLILIISMFKETLLIRTRCISVRLTLITFIYILKCKKFIFNMLISTLFLGGVFTFVTLSSYLFQKELGLTITQFSWIFAICDLFIVIGLLANSKLVTQYGISKSNLIGISIGIISGLIFIIECMIGWFTVLGVMIPIALFNFSSGIVLPTSGASVMIIFKKRLGAVGALFGCLQMLIAAFISTVASQMIFGSENVIASVFLFVSLCAMLSYIILHWCNKT